jgi:hypothetical protein
MRLTFSELEEKLSEVTYGSSVPPHLPPSPWRYLGPHRQGRPPHIWIDSGLDTIASYRRGRAWKGDLEHLDGVWQILSRNIYLLLRYEKSYKRTLMTIPTFTETGGFPFFAECSGGREL